MLKTAIIGAAVGAVFAGAAQAQTPPKVRDATYRGTLLCDKLPFFEKAVREAIEIKIKGDDVRYVHVVRDRAETSFELGTGKLDGETLALTGEWRGDGDSYRATYEGTFVRRSAKLTGTQSWQHAGQTYTRKCTGAVKRPFAAFLPRERADDKK